MAWYWVTTGKLKQFLKSIKGTFLSGFIVINSDTEKVGYLKVLDIENAVEHETGDFLEQLKKNLLINFSLKETYIYNVGMKD